MNHLLLPTPAIYDQENNLSWSGSRPGLDSGRTVFNQGHSVTFSSARSILDPAAGLANRVKSLEEVGEHLQPLSTIKATLDS